MNEKKHAIAQGLQNNPYRSLKINPKMVAIIINYLPQVSIF